jgi:hemerythrin-like metal-binding protein
VKISRNKLKQQAMFQWDDKFSVGIQSIDNQHKEIVTSLSNLLQAMKTGKANEITSKTILDMEAYARTHFQKEEFFFDKFNYSDKEKHKEEHRFFTQKIIQLRRDLNSGRMTVAFELLGFMKDWIERHILIEDRKYMECFRENGLR